MRILIEYALLLIVSIAWIAGVVLAKGFWSVALAICIPFYSWYLVIEKIMIINNIV